MNERYRQMLSGATKQGARSLNEHVLLIDGLNLFIRNWMATPTMNSNGEHVGGVMGTLKSIKSYIDNFNPSRIIIVFDGLDGSKHRKKINPNYKANREKNRFRVNRQYKDMLNAEDEVVSMRRQFVLLNELLNYIPVQVMIYDLVEADDVISYICNECIMDTERCTVISNDGDFLQLLSDKVFVYNPTRKVLYSKESFKETYGIDHSNLLLFKAIDGDKSDNIAGVPNAGLKTIIKRLPEFVDVAGIVLDDLVSMCKDKQGKIKLYDSIIEHRGTIEQNMQIMSLSNQHIPSDIKLKIVSRYREDIPILNAKSFIQIINKHGFLDKWDNVTDWLFSTFLNVVKK